MGASARRADAATNPVQVEPASLPVDNRPREPEGRQRSMDRLESMRAFVKVVDLAGFAAAARALDLSTTMVSRHVAALEAHLGVPLLTRTTRKVTPTEAGRRFCGSARRSNWATCTSCPSYRHSSGAERVARFLQPRGRSGGGRLRCRDPGRTDPRHESARADRRQVRRPRPDAAVTCDARFLAEDEPGAIAMRDHAPSFPAAEQGAARAAHFAGAT